MSLADLARTFRAVTDAKDFGALSDTARAILAVGLLHGTPQAAPADRKAADRHRPLSATARDPLTKALAAWRAETARTGKRRPYHVLKNSTIAELVARAPTRIEELEGIPGIGPWKREHYGAALVKLIREHHRPAAPTRKTETARSEDGVDDRAPDEIAADVAEDAAERKEGRRLILAALKAAPGRRLHLNEIWKLHDNPAGFGSLEAEGRVTRDKHNMVTLAKVKKHS